MALIPNLAEIKDLFPIEDCEDRQFDLRIIAAKAQNGKNTGRNGVMFVFEVVDEDLAQNVIHNVWFGNDGTFKKDDTEKSDQMWRGVKNFIRAIGLDPEMELEPDDFIGLDVTAALTYDNGINDEGNQEFPPKNELGRIY